MPPGITFAEWFDAGVSTDEHARIVDAAVRGVRALGITRGPSYTQLRSGPRGAFIVENIMAWPGLGRLTLEALFAKDYQLVVATVVMATGLLVAGNFVADLLLAWSDPRIRLK